jgi:hypothetical protein
MVELDSKKLDYSEMSDEQLEKHEAKNYSFKFM